MKIFNMVVIGLMCTVLFVMVFSCIYNIAESNPDTQASRSFNDNVRSYVSKCIQAGGRWVWKIQHQEVDTQSQTLVQGTCFMPEPESQQKAQEPNDNAEKL